MTEDTAQIIPDEEEAHYYHTLLAFEELVRNYGMEVIMETVEDDIYIDMFDFFMPPEDENDGEGFQGFPD